MQLTEDFNNAFYDDDSTAADKSPLLKRSKTHHQTTTPDSFAGVVTGEIEPTVTTTALLSPPTMLFQDMKFLVSSGLPSDEKSDGEDVLVFIKLAVTVQS